MCFQTSSILLPYKNGTGPISTSPRGYVYCSLSLFFGIRSVSGHGDGVSYKGPGG